MIRNIFIVFWLFSVVASADEQSLKIKKIADNVYQHVSYQTIEPWGMVSASGLIVVDGKDAYIIDTPWSQGDTQQLVNWIESKGFYPKSAIITHFHEDASGGLSFLNQSRVKTYATAKTNDLLRIKGREPANSEITSSTFQLVSDAIEIFYPGAGHTVDNVVVWLPQKSILFGGCFVKSLESKSLGNTEDASVQAWPDSIQNVIQKYPNIEVVVPGHGKAGDIELLRHTEKLALKIQSLQ
ncbi:subclass B1 metallo-beta-lactamase [Shewanella gelidii]|nr:subclass B1 metallo-beta-lactamase [Shewanella gelidii]MCL1097858.1 subclass B1 metallo-beta-lactamase [Shewanella gelidii]